MKTLWLLLLIPALAFGQNDAYPKSDASLVAWYKLDGNYLDEISSSSGSDVNGDAGNPTSSTDAKNGTAYRFPDGAWEAVSLVNSTLLNGATKWTMLAWKKPTAQRLDSTLLCFRKTDNSHLWGIASMWDDATSWRIWINDGGQNGRPYPLNLWSMEVSSYDATGYLGSNSVIKTFEFYAREPAFYVLFAPGAAGTFGQDRVPRLGADYFSSDRYYYSGFIDNIMIWSRVITRNEIEQLYSGRWRLTLGEISGITQGQGLGIGD